ncbi:MAG: hypothetical protein R2711_17195 [Acidimicrobiales bacterium]
MTPGASAATSAWPMGAALGDENETSRCAAWAPASTTGMVPWRRIPPASADAAAGAEALVTEAR